MREYQPTPWRLALVAAIVFFLALFLYNDKTDFPFFYHTDEPTKVDQLLNDKRNFFHPLLLLNSAGLIHQIEGRPSDPQSAVMAGRLATGIFSAAAVALAVVVCVINGGWLAGLLCAVALMSESSLYEFGHYFKEDPAMNFGLACFCLAATLYDRRRTVLYAALLGVACGLTVSGKYLGILALPFGIWVLVGSGGGASASARALSFVLGLVAAAAVCNWQIFLEAGQLVAGFGSEIGRVQDRYDESGAFHEKAWHRISVAFSPLTGLLLAGYLFSPLYRKKRLTVAQWSFIGIPMAFAIILLLVSRTGGRYNAPITFLSLVCASLAAAWIVQALAHHFPRWAMRVLMGGAVVFTALFLITQGPELVQYWKNLRFDSRGELMKYVQANLPASAVIAEEYDVRLPDPAKPDRVVEGLVVPQGRFVTKYKQSLADVGTVEELRGKGITHVVIVWSNEKKKLSKTGPEKWAALDDDARKRAMFYYQLADESVVSWECRGGAPDHVRPPLRLYQITPAP